jgi:hypothetical protein
MAAILGTRLLLAMSGCGDSAALPQDSGVSAGKGLEVFLGTWVPTSSSIALNCAGQVSTAQVTQSAVWQIGTTSDLMQPPDSSGCPLLANTSGRTATGLPNQQCTESMSGLVLILTLSSYTFVVDATGTTATEVAVGSALVMSASTTTSCSYAETARYSKVP